MRVLIVDDDPEIRVLLQTVLSFGAFDAELSEAANGPEALAVLDTVPVDVVLLDVMMPGMDGFEVLAAIRSRPALADLPIVMLTARAAESDHIAAFRGGADAYLVKPFDIDELAGVIGNVLAVGAPAQQYTDQKQREPLVRATHQPSSSWPSRTDERYTTSVFRFTSPSRS
jgi:DNA-binding response OmpR family regulator